MSDFSEFPDDDDQELQLADSGEPVSLFNTLQAHPTYKPRRSGRQRKPNSRYTQMVTVVRKVRNVFCQPEDVPAAIQVIQPSVLPGVPPVVADKSFVPFTGVEQEIPLPSDQNMKYLIPLQELDLYTGDLDPNWQIVRVVAHRRRLIRARRPGHRARRDLHVAPTHRTRVKVLFDNGCTSWTDLDAVRLQDARPLVEYAKHHRLTSSPDWLWTKPYLEPGGDQQLESVRMAFAVRSTAAKYKFGIEVPRSMPHALMLDRQNGNNNWKEAIDKELKQLSDYQTFIIPEDPEFDWSEYKQIAYHIVFDVKVDQRAKARLVANPTRLNETPDREEVYSGVVGMDVIRLGFTVASIQGLECCVGDIGNAFLYGRTREKVYIIAGKEFGPELEGKRLVVYKGLYGLATSAARYHEVLSAELRTMGFRPSKVDYNLWMRKSDDGYEYLATYVDDICVWAKDPMSILHRLKERFIMKGVGRPEYYLGANIVETHEDNIWYQHNVTTSISSKTYIGRTLERLATMAGVEQFRTASTPMDDTYHPELEDSDFLNEKNHNLFRAIIGSLNWLVTLGRIDIAYATNTLARFSMAPRNGHLKAAFRVLGYLRSHIDDEIKIDPRPFEYSPLNDKVKKNLNWQEFYPDATEEQPIDPPAPVKNKRVQISVYVDADHAHDQVTRRSVTGVILFINQTPVRWISKRQSTVETSTYGSEMVAARIATDLIIEYRYALRMLGLEVDGPSWMFGDNMSVILSTTMPSSSLKKKHLSIAYHRIREMIACNAIKFVHVDSQCNYADLLTKPLPKAVHARLTAGLTRRKDPTIAPLIVQAEIERKKDALP
jgi:hypothetical protein